MVSPGRASASAADNCAAVPTSTVRPVGPGVADAGPEGDTDTDGEADGAGDGEGDGEPDGDTDGDGTPPEHGAPLTRQPLGLPSPVVLKPNVWVPPAATVPL